MTIGRKRKKNQEIGPLAINWARFAPSYGEEGSYLTTGPRETRDKHHDDPSDIDVSPGDPAVLAALDVLPPRYQAVLSLRHIEGLTPPETAEALGLSPSVLAVTSHRARRALEKALRKMDAWEGKGSP